MIKNILTNWLIDEGYAIKEVGFDSSITIYYNSWPIAIITCYDNKTKTNKLNIYHRDKSSDIIVSRLNIEDPDVFVQIKSLLYQSTNNSYFKNKNKNKKFFNAIT